MKEYLNKTPHRIVVRRDPSNEPVLLDSDQVLESTGRAFITTASENEIENDPEDIPEAEIEYGPITDLPDPTDGVVIVVAMPTAQFLAAAGRTADIRYPDTGKPEYCVRDAKNNPFATRRLLRAKVGKQQDMAQCPYCEAIVSMDQLDPHGYCLSHNLY